MPQNLSQIEEHSGSIQERRGWRAYQHAFHGKDDRPLARSLYAIQLEEWFQNLRAVGKDPTACVKIVLSDDFDRQSDHVVNDVIEWLGLPSSSPTLPERQQQQQQQQRKLPKNPKGMVTTYTSAPMKPETRQKLEHLFAPYNRRLYKLLGPEWEGIFDDDSQKKQKK